MSLTAVEAIPTRSVERVTSASRLARWFRPQEIRERRERAAEADQHIRDIKWLWRQACEVTGLGRLVFTPSGPTVSIPMIGRVTPGPPTSFTVRPQPGQLPADFEAAAPRIAAAMGVADVRIRPLAAEWIVIELVTAPARTDRLELPEAATAPVLLARRPRYGAAAA